MRTLIPLFLFALLLASASPGSHAVSASLQQPPAGTSQPFQASAGSPFPPAGSGTAPRGNLPNSTLPGPNPSTCSTNPIQASTQCSAFNAQDRCSLQCGDQFGCSALGNPAAGTEAECSAFEFRAICSILQPPLNLNGSAGCSTANEAPGQEIRCSVFGLNAKTACSAENPPGSAVHCSVFAANQICSVLNTGSTNRAFCSTGRPAAAATKQCSALLDSAQCSVILGGKGVCSHLKGAPQGSCSTQVGGLCSVIGGASGDLCVQ